MKRSIPFYLAGSVFVSALLTTTAYPAEYHVAISGKDENAGTKNAPFRTIQHAADLAQPGDVITVHAGVYRERVAPPRGGTSDKKRIVYQAARREKVTITGSEVVKNWARVTNDTWSVRIPNAFFGTFNPYADVIHGDWFDPKKRQHHTGAVYLNGDWLDEAARLGDALQPAGKDPMWYGEVTNGTTILWAQFKGVNPNGQNVEINVRQTVFTPEKAGINYLTVRGFDLRDAATPWAPPTARQIGLVSALWCKGWIIEGNEISYSRCGGVALGKYGDEWDNGMAIEPKPEWLIKEMRGGTGGYIATIERALTNGWNQATVGSHIVRNNHIHHCEQAGIVGSLGCSFSTVTGNDLHDIHVRNLFGGAEMAGIKFHGAIDVVIHGNHIYRCGSVAGIWLDWMGQGAQVTGNLLHDNSSQDMFLEMQHGPILVANNLFLSKPRSFELNSQGVAFAHNLILGPLFIHRGDKRVTPFQKAHTTELAGMYPAADGDSGDYRFYNNLFVAPSDLRAIDKSVLPCFAAGNLFAKGAQPSKFDTNGLVLSDSDAGVKLEQKPDGWYLTLNGNKSWCEQAKRQLVTTELLGKAKVSGCACENPDGSPLKINRDYGNHKRQRNPFPGPFERVSTGQQQIKVWPVSAAVPPAWGAIPSPAQG